MKKTVIRILVGLIALLVLFIVGVVIVVQSTWDSPEDRRIPAVQASNDPGALERGEYLFKYGHGCWGCHSKVMDANSSPSGGRPFDLTSVGPGFGMFYAPNITPDKETGIGGWTDGEIVRAIREGVGKDGRKLFPIMPVAALKGLSDDDVLALVSYLRSLEPVANKVPANELSFAAKALFAFGVLKPEPEITEPIVAPQRGVTAEWGKYVATNAGLCYDCHTPRNLEDGSFYNDSLFAGGTIGFGGKIDGEAVEVYAANITMDEETGIGSWTEGQFLTAARYGVRADGRAISPHMPFMAYAFWDEEDVRAIYAYLKTIPTFRRERYATVMSPSITEGSGVPRGKDIFSASCRACHGENGLGTAFTNVVLAEVSPTLTDDELLAFVKEGNIGLRMPPFGKTYTDDQLKDVISYIRTWEPSTTSSE